MEPVAGPSRPRRLPNAPMDLGDRINAARRKQATNQEAGPSRPSARSRPDAADEYSRGPSQPARRALFDPSRAIPPPRVASPLQMEAPPWSQPQPASPSRHRSTPDGPSRRAESPSRPPRPSRKLFDPTVHDPHQFSRPPVPVVPPPTASPLLNEGNLSRARDLPRSVDPALTVRRPHLPRTAEEEADKERERRRRKEGSERGSGSSGRKKEDSGGRSKGARSLGDRSSEGSESFKDRERGKGKGDTGVKAILKDIHDRIKAIELDLTEMHRKMAADPEAGIAVLLQQSRADQARGLSASDDAALWLDLIGKHKQLADLHHDFLTRIFDPLVPPSLHQLTVRYNIPSRLWQNGFHLLLERLRHSWMTGHPTALDLLTDFVYDGYKFYTDLLEDIALVGFRTAWIEALGDLARYRMAIARQLSLSTGSSSGKGKGKGKSQEHGGGQEGGESFPDGASIGAEVAERWDVEDTDTWRQTAAEWYSMGITEKPGEGRLHHHLALLARDMPDGEGRALHHFTRSLVVTHEFPTARESILGLFDLSGQRRSERLRSGDEDGAMNLFIRLHGMLFTRIELDRFDETLAAFLRVLEGGAGQVEWMIMASVGIAGMMQYGASEGVLRKALAQEGAERRRAQTTSGEVEEVEVDEEEEKPAPTSPAKQADNGDLKGTDPDTWPLPLTCAFRLAFDIFRHTLHHPTIAQGVHSIPNPYLSTFLTFLATLARQPASAAIITPWIPWSDLVAYVNAQLPSLDFKPETKLIAGQPVPEDWLLRGAEWVGRRVYERGFWKVKPSSGRGSGGIVQPTQRGGERFGSEMDVLVAHYEEGADLSQGVVDAPEGEEEVDGPVEVGKRRWRRVGWAVGVMCRHVSGLELGDGGVEVVEPLKGVVEGLERKQAEVSRGGVAVKKQNGWKEEETREDTWGPEEEDDPELAVLRDRFRHLQSLISPSPDIFKSARQPKTSRASTRRVLQGYTTLIFDTNVLLSSLTLVSRLIESGRWTIVIPLPVLTELDGLAREPPPLGLEAVLAISYLEANVRSRSMVLRIQTTKGSYLSDLRLRTEASQITEADKDRKTMDDKILDVARWQLDHFTDRSLMLGGKGLGGMEEAEVCKAVLVTFDRNLRLRARARGVDAVDEREMADILGK